MGYKHAEAREPQPSGVWMDLKGGHLQPQTASAIYPRAPNKWPRASALT